MSDESTPRRQPEGTAAESDDTTTEAARPASTATDSPEEDPPDSRTYVRVTPTDDPLDPATIRRHVGQLARLGDDTGGGGLLDRLTGSGTEPVRVAVRIVAPPGGGPLCYEVGVTDPDAVPALEGTLRTLVPDSYELEARARPHLPGFCERALEGTTDAKRTEDEADGEPDHDPDPDARERDTTTPDTPTLAAVEYVGDPERRRDWQTRLTPFAAFLGDGDDDEQARLPLAAVLEAMTDRPDGVGLVYQCVLEPLPDWTAAAADRRERLRAGEDTVGQRVAHTLLGTPDPEDRRRRPATERRLAELEEKDARTSWAASARLVAVATDPGADPVASVRPARTALDPLSRTTYAVTGRLHTGGAARSVLADVADRAVCDPTEPSLTDRLPLGDGTQRGLVVDASEVGGLCLLGGRAVTAAGARGLATTPGERTSLPRPPAERLAPYREPGLALGRPLDQDGQATGEPVAVPPDLQRLHAAWFGKTGSGKTTSLVTAILRNHAATDGASVLIDPKGDGMAAQYLRAHHATYGDLADVLYFDCEQVLPALGFFDIRDELAAGVPRTTAVEDAVDHYVEVLAALMGRERFEQAVRSPDIIRYLVKAQFDPVNGADAFPHAALHDAVRTMRERQAAPAVADADLEAMLAGVTANRDRTFDDLMQGVANRVEKIPMDRRLGTVFDHVPTDPEDPHFDLAEYLDEDVVIVIDTGGLRADPQRALALLVLSNLWTALRRRARREGLTEPEGESEAEVEGGFAGEEDEAVAEAGDGTGINPDTDSDPDSQATGLEADTVDEDALPLVNVYLEEAADLAVSDLLSRLLAQARGFGCAITLAMQFPAQLRRQDRAVYDELLNNVGTYVAGNVPIDERLARRLATADMPPEAVGTRLRALRRGHWLTALPARFDRPAPRPFLVESLDPPPGDPAGPAPLDAPAERAYRAARVDCELRTAREAGLTLETPGSGTAGDGLEPESTTAPAGEAGGATVATTSALPHTRRLPPTVTYDDAAHATRCTECGDRYDPTQDGLARALRCCGDPASVDRDDVPVCALGLKLTPEELRAADHDPAQLRFLQAVYDAQQLRHDRRGYDIVRDSMVRLREYVDVDPEAVDDLVQDGLLRVDTDHPHRLYSVTPRGRRAIGESYRRGIEYGHGAGDLEESAEHVLMVETARRHLQQAYVDDPDSPVVEVVPYYDLDPRPDATTDAGSVGADAAAFMGGSGDGDGGEGEDGSDTDTEGDANGDTDDDAADRRRLDLVGLDEAGEVVVAVEAERVNHDTRRAVPEDYDKMAAVDPAAAIWVVPTREDAHDVLAALNDPLAGDTRVAKTYADTTPPEQFRIDTPGLTDVTTIASLRDRVLGDD